MLGFGAPLGGEGAVALGGLAFGAGTAGAFLLWARSMAALSPWRLSFFVAAGLVVQHGAKVIACAGGGGAFPAVALAAAAASMALLGLRLRAQRAGKVPAAPTPRAAFPPLEGAERAAATRAFLASVWKPSAGAMICALIGGFGRNSVVAGSEVALYGSLVTLGLMVAAVGVLVALRASLSVEAMPQFLLPVAAAVLIVVPFLAEPASGLLAALASPVNALGFFFFDSLLWVCAIRGADRSRLSVERAMAAVRAGCGAAMVAGLLMAPFMGEPLVKALCLMLLAAYLLALTLSATRASARAQGAARAPGGVLGEGTAQPASADTAALVRDRLRALAADAGLSPREEEVFLYLARGHGSAYIAEALTVSADTVKTHAKRIYRKLGVASREELLALAEQFLGAGEEE